MRLTEEEYYDFWDIHLGMMLYAGQKEASHNFHFAIVNDTIIAQGASSREVKDMVAAMLPKGKQDWAFYFNLK